VQVEAEDIDSSDKCTGRIAGSVLKENLRRHYPYQLKLLTIVEMVETAAFNVGLLVRPSQVCNRTIISLSSNRSSIGFWPEVGVFHGETGDPCSGG
jgi:hypothetical protein